MIRRVLARAGPVNLIEIAGYLSYDSDYGSGGQGYERSRRNCSPVHSREKADNLRIPIRRYASIGSLGEKAEGRRANTGLLAHRAGAPSEVGLALAGSTSRACTIVANPATPPDRV